MEDSTIKAGVHFPELPHCDDEQKVWTFSEINVPDAKFGDIIQCGDYRYTKAYIVGKDNVLIENPDRSDSGHLSIPFEVTQYLTDAVGKYSEQEIFDIDLRHDDVFLVNWFGTVPAEFQELKFRWVAVMKCVNITFPNGIRNDFHPPTVKRFYNQETHSLEDVLKFYEGTKGPRCRVTMTYTISPENMARYEAEHSNKAEVDKEVAALEEEDKQMRAAAGTANKPQFGGVMPDIHSVLVPKPNPSNVVAVESTTSSGTAVEPSPAVALPPAPVGFGFANACSSDFAPPTTFTNLPLSTAPITFPSVPVKAEPTPTTATAPPRFGVSSAPAAGAVPAPAWGGFGFGAPAAASTTSAAAPTGFGFGACSAPPPAAAPTGFGFGASTAPPPAAAPTGFGFGASSASPPAAAPTGFVFGASSASPPAAPTGFGFGASSAPPPAPSTNPSTFPAGFGFGGAYTAPTPAAAAPAPAFPPYFAGFAGNRPSMAFMMKKIQLEANIKYNEPKTPASFSKYLRRGGMTAFGKMGTVVFEGPKTDLEELLNSLKSFYETYQFTTEVVDI